MITPKQVPQKPEKPNRQAEIEAFFDRHLSMGTLAIGHTRSGWSMADVDAVLDKYRAHGWTVRDTGSAYLFSPAQSA